MALELRSNIFPFFLHSLQIGEIILKCIEKNVQVWIDLIRMAEDWAQLPVLLHTVVNVWFEQGTKVVDLLGSWATISFSRML